MRNLRKIVNLDLANANELFPNLPALNEPQEFFPKLTNLVKEHLAEVAQRTKKNIQEAAILYQKTCQDNRLISQGKLRDIKETTTYKSIVNKP